MPKANMAEVKASQFPVLPAGVYRTKVRVNKTLSKDGAEMWTLVHEVLEGPAGAPTEDSRGKKIWDHLTWQDTAMWRVKHVMEAYGYDVGRNEEIDWQPHHLEVKVTSVHVIVDEYQGKKTNRISKNGYYKIDGSDAPVVAGAQPKPIAPEEELPF